MLDGRLEQLPIRLQGVIEAERERVVALRDAPGDETAYWLARGRMDAWMTIHRFLTEYEDALEKWEKGGSSGRKG